MKIWMALGLVMAAAGGTMAQAQTYDAERTLTYFTPAALKATLHELGATTADRDGVPNITVEFSNGLKADAVTLACSDIETSTDCLGTSILATFEQPEGANAEAIFQAINEYNYRQNFGRAYLGPDGAITLRMYIIADGGITMGNYRQQIGLFEKSAERFLQYLYN